MDDIGWAAGRRGSFRSIPEWHQTRLRWRVWGGTRSLGSTGARHAREGILCGAALHTANQRPAPLLAPISPIRSPRTSFVFGSRGALPKGVACSGLPSASGPLGSQWDVRAPITGALRSQGRGHSAKRGIPAQRTPRRVALAWPLKTAQRPLSCCARLQGISRKDHRGRRRTRYHGCTTVNWRECRYLRVPPACSHASRRVFAIWRSKFELRRRSEAGRDTRRRDSLESCLTRACVDSGSYPLCAKPHCCRLTRGAGSCCGC